MIRRGALALVLLAACAPNPAVSHAGDTAAPTIGLARPVVAEPAAGRPRYVREEWQPHGWDDEDHDGCDTRAEVLMAESSVPTTRRPNCTVLTGTWADPYTGQVFTAAADVQIDHLVALGDAAASGGWAWTAGRKQAFANDLADQWALNATAGPENQRKSDYGPDRWMPPRAEFVCTYVYAYAAIKARWGLTVTPAQWAAIERTWANC